MAEGSALSGFVPFNEAHAIVSASVSIQFNGQVSSENWPRLRRAIFEVGRQLELGAPEPFFSTSVTFEPNKVGFYVNAPTPGVSDLSGLSYTRVDEEDNIIDRFVATKEQIQVSTNSYIRWAPFFKKASDFISFIYNFYAEELVFSAAKTEYWDRFDYKGSGEPDLCEIFSQESPWLNKSFLNTLGGAHSYSGRFDKLDERLRRLTNVRIDYADFPTPVGGAQRSAVIHTMLQDATNAPGYAETGRNAYPVSDVLGLLDRQHFALKELLGGIITAQARARIGL